MRLIDADYAKEYAKKHRGNINYSRTIPSIDDIPTVDAIPTYQVEKLIIEYLSKCEVCDSCIAEYYCIENGLKQSRTPCNNCPEKIKNYLKQLVI